MTFLKYSLLLIILNFIHFSLSAQEQAAQSVNEGSIEEQFDFIINKSTNWNDDNGRAYEVIRRNMFLNLKTNAVDSLKAVQSRLDRATSDLSTQQKEIDALKQELATIQSTLSTVNNEKDSMTFLGMQMSKGGYSTLVWSIIIGLLVLLLFFIFRFKANNLITKAAKAKLAEVEEEFNEHRRSALEREQKVKRELQDVINKYKVQ